MLGIATNLPILQLLEEIDLDLAETAHGQRCPHCGGKLHWANYTRSPRGVDKLWKRFSLCCDQDGCRRRLTPQSVRFLGRKVYLGLMVVFLPALNQGHTASRVVQVRKVISVSRATLNRWRRWWLAHFVHTDFWKAARACFMPPVSASMLPASLVERFEGYGLSGLVNPLKFLGPITTVSGENRRAF